MNLSEETQAFLKGQKWVSSSYYLDGVENGTKATVDISIAILRAMESNWQQFQGLPTEEVFRVVRAAFEDTLKQSAEHMVSQTKEKILGAIFDETL